MVDQSKLSVRRSGGQECNGAENEYTANDYLYQLCNSCVCDCQNMKLIKQILDCLLQIQWCLQKSISHERLKWRCKPKWCFLLVVLQVLRALCTSWVSGEGSQSPQNRVLHASISYFKNFQQVFPVEKYLLDFGHGCLTNSPICLVSGKSLKQTCSTFSYFLKIFRFFNIVNLI